MEKSISPYSAHEGYPILLVKKDVIPDQIKRVFNDLKIEKTTVAGGENTISNESYNKLPNPIERLYGRNRYETAIAIAKSKFKYSTKAFLTSGEVFSDALVIGPVAGKYNSPVILVKKYPPMSFIADYINHSNINSIIFVGGENVISKLWFNEMKLLNKKHILKNN